LARVYVRFRHWLDAVLVAFRTMPKRIAPMGAIKQAQSEMNLWLRQYATGFTSPLIATEGC
jgi:hypothetical protein